MVAVPVTAKVVLVALVVVPLMTLRLPIDEEALRIMPTVEVGVMAEVPENCQLEVKAVLPDPTQTPATAKQPVRIFKPEPKVEVAVARMLMVLSPVLPMDREVPGELVPIPRAPVEVKVEVAVLPNQA